MKLFKVALNMESVVAAKSADEAIRTAIYNRENIVNERKDCWSVVGEIHKESDLPAGWDATCYHWGCTEKTINRFLQDNQEEYINFLEEEIARWK